MALTPPYRDAQDASYTRGRGGMQFSTAHPRGAKSNYSGDLVERESQSKPAVRNIPTLPGRDSNSITDNGHTRPQSTVPAHHQTNACLSVGKINPILHLLRDSSEFLPHLRSLRLHTNTPLSPVGPEDRAPYPYCRREDRDDPEDLETERDYEALANAVSVACNNWCRISSFDVVLFSVIS
ncbi:hypothetical protein B0H11DRAFT_1917422 [Mycena galericulata]|nr:hypothetical protein B0H11DRAFT_1917422 [Mycena galericulata]